MTDMDADGPARRVPPTVTGFATVTLAPPSADDTGPEPAGGGGRGGGGRQWFVVAGLVGVVAVLLGIGLLLRSGRDERAQTGSTAVRAPDSTAAQEEAPGSVATSEPTTEETPVAEPTED